MCVKRLVLLRTTTIRLAVLQRSVCFRLLCLHLPSMYAIFCMQKGESSREYERNQDSTVS